MKNMMAAVFSFNHFDNNRFTISYGDGKNMHMELPFPDRPDFSRQSMIKDYNFDGYEDVAFSVPDDGMGVYRIFTIFLYDPVIKRFKKTSGT